MVMHLISFHLILLRLSIPSIVYTVARSLAEIETQTSYNEDVCGQ